MLNQNRASLKGNGIFRLVFVGARPSWVTFWHKRELIKSGVVYDLSTRKTNEASVVWRGRGQAVGLRSLRTCIKYTAGQLDVGRIAKI